MNHLAESSSPYLRQHAHQPIDWYPWGPEAFVKAQKEQKLVLVSIGYSTCHWCHVMAHEVFDDTKVAEFQNRFYVSIKIDREERPDLDQIYMDACRMLSGQGGWPLNVLCLPDGRPLHAVTYQPKDSWIHLLGQLRVLWVENPERVQTQAETLVDALRASSLPELQPIATTATEPLTRDPLNILREVWSHMAPQFDPIQGGTIGAPKFPLPPLLETLAELRSLWGSEPSANWQVAWNKHVNTTLDGLCHGGIFDQIGGGFFRYSTDAQWHIPHFEKMLYDNAQLICVLARTQRSEPHPIWRRALLLSLENLQREFLSPEDLYTSALDADSEGREGAHYIWTQEQVFNSLPDTPLCESALETWDITRQGNWENGESVPRIPASLSQSLLPIDLSQRLLALEPVRKTLLAARTNKPRPSLDDKILLEWNALTARALLDAGRVLDDQRLLSHGLHLLDSLFTRLRDAQGSFHRSLHQGALGPLAFLPDLAQLAEACLTAYETSLEDTWLKRSEEVARIILHDYSDTQSPFFFTAPPAREELFAHRIPLHDDVIASANSVFARVLLRLGYLLENPEWTNRARQMILTKREDALNDPCYHANWLRAYVDLVVPAPSVEFSGPDAQRWAKNVWLLFPRVIIKAGISSQEGTRAQVCKDSRCLPLCTDLRATLAAISS